MTPQAIARLEELRAKKAAGPSALSSFGTGVSQGASLGFADEAAPYIEKLFAKINLTPEEYDAVYGGRSRGDLSESFKKDVRASAEAHPIATGAGTVVGSLVPTALLSGIGGVVPSVGKALTTVRGAAAAGATEGALAGAGTSEGGVGERLTGAAIGAGTGALLSGGGAAAGKLVGKVARGVRGTADEAAEGLQKISKKADEAAAGAKKAGVEAEDLIKELDDWADDIPPMQSTERQVLHVTPTKQDTRLAEFGKYVTDRPQDAASDIAYIRSRPVAEVLGPDRVQLTPNAKNNLAKIAMKDFQALGKRVEMHEAASTEILDGVMINKQRILKPFRDAMARLTRTESGGTRLYTPDNEGAARVLLKYLKGDEDELFTGLLNADNTIDALSVRTFLRDLRSGNVAAYSKQGVPLKIKANELKAVAADLRNVLRDAVKKTKGAKVAKQFDGIMDEYSADYGALKTIRKAWGWKGGDAGPDLETWYRQRVVYPLQNVVAGTTPTDSALVKSLLHMGRRSPQPRNYLQIVKDNLVASNLFPELGEGINKGTATRVWTKAALGTLKAPIQSPVTTAREVGGAALEASNAVRRQMLKKLLMNQKGLAANVEGFVSGVKDVAEKARSPLIELGRKAGDVGMRGEKLLTSGGRAAVIPGASIAAGQEMRPQGQATTQATDEETGEYRNRRTAQALSAGAVEAQGPEFRGRSRRQGPRTPLRQPNQPTPASAYPVPSNMGKYSGALRQARARGQEAEAALHYVLMQRDPDYRTAWDRAKGAEK